MPSTQTKTKSTALGGCVAGAILILGFLGLFALIALIPAAILTAIYNHVFVPNYNLHPVNFWVVFFGLWALGIVARILNPKS